jgi:hypothetical protein
VKNDSAAGGDGRSHLPFDTLAEAQTASTANDIIYVYFGNGTNSGQNAGFTMKAGQKLYGQGIALVVNSQSLVAAGSRSVIGNSGGDGVTATNLSGNIIRGLNITGSDDGVSMSTSGAAAGDIEIADNTIHGSTNYGVRIVANSTNNVNVSVHDNTLSGVVRAMDFQRTSGIVTITAFDDNVVPGTSGGGIVVAGVGGVVTFDTSPGGAIQPVPGGNTIIGVPGDGVGSGGLTLTNVVGTLNFSDLDVFATAGTALDVDGGVGGFALTVTANASTLEANAGAAALLVDVTTLDLQLASMTSTSSPSNGVLLSGVTGTWSAPSGSSITNATSADFQISASDVAVTYGGTITDDQGQLITISSNTGTRTHAFTGAITDGNDGDGSGVTMSGNSAGTTVRFSGGLVLSTGSAAALSASGGGVLEICDENPCNNAATGGLINTIVTTTGTALSVSSTNIGANNLEFRSISAGTVGSTGPANGIFLNVTGSAGGLKVKGNGGTCTYATPTCSGGTIASATGNAVHLVSTSNVSLTRVRIHDNDTNGIYGDELTGLTIADSVISDNDVTNVSAFEAGIKFNELYGTNSITNTVVRGTKGDNIRLEMATGTLTNLTLTSTTVGPTANVGGGYTNGFSIVTTGTPILNVTVNTSTFTGVDSAKQQSSGILTSIGGGTTNLTITNSTFEHENIAIDLGASAGGTHKFNVDNNTVNFHRTNAINIVGNGVIDGTVNNNDVGNGTADSGSQNSYGIGVSHRGNSNWKLALTNNTIRNTDFEGIFVRTGDLLAADNGRVDLTLTGNTVFTPDDNSGFPANPKGIHLRSRQSTTLCMNIQNNAAQGAGAAGYHLQESDTSSLSFQGWNTNAVTTLTANGNTTAGGAPTTNEVGAPFAGACTTASPTFP